MQARFADEQIVARRGASSTYARKGDSGGEITFSFCPTCGAIVTYVVDRLPGFVVVPVGVFADPGFPPPQVSIYEARRHPWGPMPGITVEHVD